MAHVTRITFLIAFIIALISAASGFASSSAADDALRNAEREVRYIHSSLSGDDPRFSVESVISGLNGPTAFTFLPDGRIVFVEQSGLVRTARDGALLETPLLDLHDIVNSYPDRGLTGIAVDPDFARNDFLYLSYAYDPPGSTQDSDEQRSYRVARYTFVDDHIDRASEAILLESPPAVKRGHIAGALRFAPDDALFISMGDGVNQFQVSEQPQNLDSLNGKILRMDRTGAGLPDNPFFDPNAPRSVRSRVWAFGLREPFRFAIHPRTGIPYVGNVGFHYHESIARATPGANFGWPCIDGVIPHRRARFTPICNTLDYATIEPSDVNYPHLRTQAAVIGGDFNFGDALPADTRGDFFFGDYIRGWVRRAELGSDGRIVRVLPVLTNVGNLVDMQFGPDGNLYVLSYGGGSLSRITASSAAAAAPSPDPAP